VPAGRRGWPGHWPRAHRGLAPAPARRGRHDRRPRPGAAAGRRDAVWHHRAPRECRGHARSWRAGRCQHLHAEQVPQGADAGGARGRVPCAVREADGAERRGGPRDAHRREKCRQATDDQLLIPLLGGLARVEGAGRFRHVRRVLLRPHGLAPAPRHTRLRRLVRRQGTVRRWTADRPGRAPPRPRAVVDGLSETDLGAGQHARPDCPRPRGEVGQDLRHRRPRQRVDPLRQRRDARPRGLVGREHPGGRADGDAPARHPGRPAAEEPRQRRGSIFSRRGSW